MNRSEIKIKNRIKSHFGTVTPDSAKKLNQSIYKERINYMQT